MSVIQRKQRPSTRTSATTFVVVLLTGALGGCADDETPGPVGQSGGGDAFVVATRVWDDTSTNSYFHVLPSLEQATAVDPSQALEVPGSARLFAFEGLGWFGLGESESPTISRYTLDDGGALVKGDAISLQPFGVQSLWPTNYVVSPTKVYHPDRAGEQLVVWNPTTMEVQGTIPLPDTAREGYLALYGYGWVLRGKTLLFSVGWFDWKTTDTILPETGLVAIDTETDTVVRFDVDDRCGGITQSVETASGDAYFVSSGLAGAAYHLERLETEPCALRIAKGADAFDPDFALRLSELTGGAIAGDPIPAGGDSLFLRVFDEDLATIGEDTKTSGVTGQPAWHWWRWDTATNEAAAIPELAPSPANVSFFEVDGRVFTIDEKSGSTESTLIELTAEGGPKLGLTTPGYLHGLAKVR
ncbi:hypothetical protein SOCE26_097140 [Sorangium cellulosum]|uniref:Secreted protein n=1 Tax=Sorangium cellulosum TaxID=56 RepID=A0A2L0F9H0_SORCE|nr:hypothetical protein [Sorangium cellulosum]AUX48183.1 hypothetical protein SOCE26_097140 [Sorangium cellulosum]